MQNKKEWAFVLRNVLTFGLVMLDDKFTPTQDAVFDNTHWFSSIKLLANHMNSYHSEITKCFYNLKELQTAYKNTKQREE